MLSLSTLQVLWFFLTGGVIITYAATAGFDFGVTLISPFLTNEMDRRIALNAVGPTWDGNQTWIVFAGGVLFSTYPVVYGTMFSGLYAAMLCILWSFFLRPPGFDYRSRLKSMAWRRSWDWGLFISALIPTLIFGVTFGNLMVGMPFHFDAFWLRDFYTGNFWGLLNQFSLVCGILTLVMFIMHGAALLVRRTEGDLKVCMHRVHRIAAGLFFVLLTVAALLVTYTVKGYILIKSPVNPLTHPLDNVVSTAVGAWTHSYATYPWKISGPILAYLGVIASLLTPITRPTFLFWCSTISVIGTVMTAGFNLYPFIAPSSTNLAQSLTIWNATSTQYRLNTTLWIACTVLLIILVYKLYAYWSVWHKKSTINADDVTKNDHIAY